jgi:uncharacterized membrane protein YeaQ/YmgE (transglycosylase-associated protein family)
MRTLLLITRCGVAFADSEHFDSCCVFVLSQPLAPVAKERPMNILIWLIVGGIVGWLASLIMRSDAQQGILLNVVVGIIGALIGGWVVSPMVGVGTINDAISIGSILVSLLGAVLLLGVVNLFRRGRVR